MSDPTVLLVIPCYNEESRLQLDLFQERASSQLQFLFVNDGSGDHTGQILSDWVAQQEHCFFFNSEVNLGKAEAIRQGILWLKQQGRLENLSWVGFWDADLATPLFEVKNMLQFAQFYQKDPVALFGSRVYRLGSQIQRSPLRHYLARVFATVASHLFHIESYDSQCGAKLFRPEVLEIAFAEPFVSRWIFDVEILIRLKNRPIVEYPLLQWTDVAGSKLKKSDFFRVFLDLVAMKKHYTKG